MESAPFEWELFWHALVRVIPIVALVIIFWAALTELLLGDGSDREE